ncbi:MAG: 16S rRNA (cytosine(967)-C(5))-methyltransferase RsmB [Burkholderiaceae bacterium]
MTLHRAPLGDEMLAAARALASVQAGRRLPDALDEACATLTAPSRGPARDMAYRCVRGLGLLRGLSRLLNHRQPDPQLLGLQWVALEQLLASDRADAVVVDQAVGALRRCGPGPAAAAGFLNATLRRFGREREALLASARSDPEARYNLPRWWIDALRKAWPEHWEQIIDASSAQAPMVLRVNARRIERDVLRDTLTQAGMPSRVVGPQAIALDQALPVQAIPGFEQGWWSVQDPGAQMSAFLLGARDGERVLDACAAPGGKTGHLLELADLRLTALDIDPVRCRRIEENLSRLGLLGPEVKVTPADAARTDTWWDGEPFDRILLDAPCSASGILRRHPDVRWLRRRGDLATLMQAQQRLLDALWPLLRPGGTLLYVTCSVFPEEGEQMIQAFQRRHSDALREPISWAWPDGSSEPVAQLFPSDQFPREHDGFFHARLSRRP